MNKNILILAGDGIGPEITQQAVRVIEKLNEIYELDVSITHAAVGGSAYDQYGTPLPESTLQAAKQADAILLGAVGGPKWEALDISVRPEKALLGLRSELSLFANLRPAILYPQLADASSLKPELVSDLDILIVRELTGGIYFGQPRGVRTLESGEKQGYNTYIYSESEIRRIGKVAFESAQVRGGKLCSVDKANVLEVTQLWRDVMTELAADYPDVELSHMYVDNAAMQLIRQPKQFDVMVTGNMFGDILSDSAAMLTGSIGMLPSASLDDNDKGMYEPIHGSAPDIAGQNCANPIATILSVAMMFKYTFKRSDVASSIELAIGQVLDEGDRTADIHSSQYELLSTEEMGSKIVNVIS